MNSKPTKRRPSGRSPRRTGQTSLAIAICLALMMFFAAVVWGSQRLAFDQQAWQASVLVQLLCIVAIVQTLFLGLMALRRT